MSFCVWLSWLVVAYNMHVLRIRVDVDDSSVVGQCGRDGSRRLEVPASGLVIVEGTLALYDARIRYGAAGGVAR